MPICSERGEDSRCLVIQRGQLNHTKEQNTSKRFCQGVGILKIPAVTIQLLSEPLSLQAVIFQTRHLLKGYVYSISLAQAGNHWGQIAVQISDRASDSESSCEPWDGS